jgi:hypothetical protein
MGKYNIKRGVSPIDNNTFFPAADFSFLFFFATVHEGGVIEAFSLGARASCPHKPAKFDK